MQPDGLLTAITASPIWASTLLTMAEHYRFTGDQALAEARRATKMIKIFDWSEIQARRVHVSQQKPSDVVYGLIK